ncbi:MAG: hypothetical protein JSW47_08190 [Phycisphaerales bacterium]|nr:MAG: hypothetical protein JSW47_08190 [Phycisphaerales bacterium]
MNNGTTSKRQSEAEKAEKFGWAKWNAPLVLLLLAFTFMMMLILSNKSQTALDDGGLVIYVLTALLCTLVAVSIILIGCAERARETERHIRSLGANITKSHNESLQVGQAGLRANEQLGAKISGLGEGQRLLRERLSELKNAIARDNQLLRQIAKSYKQQLDDKIATLALDQQKTLTRIDSLQQAGMSISQQITATGDHQESLRTTIKERADHLGGRMSDVTAAQEKLHDHVDSLRKLIQAVAGDITNIAQEQTTLHEAVESGSAESVRHLETLSQDHRNVHNHLDHLGESVRNVGNEVAETIARRVASHEDLQAYAEVLAAQMSSLAAAEERLESSVNAARVNIEKICAEQVSLDRTLQDNTTTVATTMGRIEQFQQTLQAEIGDLAQVCQRTVASIEAMTAEQASLREIAGSKNDELTGQIAAFSEDQKAALAAFGEDLKQAATSVESIAHNQNNIENAVSGTCQESLSKLDAITDSQERWGRQLEANEAQVNAMVADIDKLQQQVAAVLEMLNTCVQGLTDVLDSNNKHQFKLEDTINQNLTTIAELISQVKANRACLEAQM